MSLAPLEQPREHTAAVALNGRIIALAGRWAVRASFHRLKFMIRRRMSGRQGLRWQNCAGFAAAVVEGRIVVLGGEVLSGRSPHAG